MMQKKHWRDVGFFALGTFLGGYVLGFIMKLVSKA